MWVDKFKEELGMYHCEIDYDKFEVYETNYAPWLCTDTWVGGKAYFYQDEIICISWQNVRKSDTDFYWISKYKRNLIEKHILDISDEEDDNCEYITEYEFNEELGEGFKISYGSQLLTDNVIEEKTGLNCEVVEKWSSYDDIDKWGKSFS